MDVVFGLIYYMIIAWLILKSPQHFHRGEIDKTYGGLEDFESGSRPEDVIKVYEKQHMNKEMGYQLIDHKEGRQTFMVYHKILNRAPLLEYAMTDNFFRKRSVKNIAHTLKILGFSHLVFLPGQETVILPAPMYHYRHTWLRKRLTKSTFLSFTRWMFTALSVFTVFVAILAGDILFTLEFLPLVLILTLISYILYVLREVWLYFKQNRYSVKLGEEMGLDRQEMDFIRHYLRNSLFRFIILQLFIIIFIFVLIVWMLITFSAE